MFKSKAIVQCIQSVLISNGVALQDSPAATSFILAEALGNTLSLPSSAVKDGTQWFNVTHRTNLFKSLNEINEIHVIDMDEVEEITFKLWLTRYYLTHEPDHPSSQGLVRTLVENGTCSVPAAYTELTNKYRHLHVDRFLMDTVRNANVI